MNILEQAIRLSKLGLSVHWLEIPPQTACPFLSTGDCQSWKPIHGARCECPGKGIHKKNWSTAPYASPDDVKSGYVQGANLGLHTGIVHGARINVVGVDLDSIDAVSWAQQSLRLTPIRTRTSKGEHWYYRHPGGAHIRNNTRVLGRKVDIRADAGNIVIPPSMHPSGHCYQEIEPWTAEAFAEMPLFDRTWLETDEVKRARAYLAEMPEAVSGNWGHTTIFNAACALIKGFGLTLDMSLELLREYNNRCKPPWTDDELRHKVQEATKARRSERYLLDSSQTTTEADVSLGDWEPPTPLEESILPACVDAQAG